MKSSRAYHLKRLYGITDEQYERLLEDQKGCCGVCKRHHSEFKTKLCVDHDHKTGRIRGILCQFCNRRVIGRHTSPELFKSAFEYLSFGTSWFVPEKKRKKKKRVTKSRSRRVRG